MVTDIRKRHFLKKKKIFAEFGEKNYWFPRITPADPEKVKIHNNVKVATDVYFCTHDVLHNLFMDSPTLFVGGIKDIQRISKYSITYLLGRKRLLCMA